MNCNIVQYESMISYNKFLLGDLYFGHQTVLLILRNSCRNSQCATGLLPVWGFDGRKLRVWPSIRLAVLRVFCDPNFNHCQTFKSSSESV